MNREEMLWDLAAEVFSNSYSKGFWTKDKNGNPTRNVGEAISLIHSELSEMLEAFRNNNFTEKDSVAEEAADVIIRLCDLCFGLGIEFHKALEKKLEYNKSRPYLHNKKF